MQAIARGTVPARRQQGADRPARGRQAPASSEGGEAGAAEQREPIPLARLLGDEAVFGRTVAGQEEVIFDRQLLAAPARRLLLLVNGETPLRVLLDLLHLQDSSAGAAVLQLLQKGLVEFRFSGGAPEYAKV